MNSPDQALQTMISNMPEKTGKSLEQWKSILAEKGFEKHGQVVKYLKEIHGVTHGYANTIAGLAKKQAADPDNLVVNQYKGKESLLLIYVKLLNEINKFGNDVEIAPKKANVSLRTKRQFVLIQPSTKTRIDIGLKIKDKQPEGILEASGPFGSMCTHRIQITDLKDITSEVIAHMRLAYEQSRN